MKSARRKALIAKRGKRNGNKLPYKILPFFVVVVLGFLFLKFNTRYWNGVDKISLVYKEKEGDVSVVVSDPVLSEINVLTIPGDTQVDVARSYGNLKIKNVWQLGVNEKIGGKLLTETVTRNFFFPTIFWDEETTGLEDGNFIKLLKFIFSKNKSNIPVGDRIKLALFSMKVKDVDRNFINLGKSQFLDKKILNDGQPGYVVPSSMSQRVTMYFSDNKIGDKNVKVNITDATGLSGVSDRLGGILQVIGGKVVSIDKKNIPEDFDCLVSGKDKETVKKIAGLFSCKTSGGETFFDLDIKIGKIFAKRF